MIGVGFRQAKEAFFDSEAVVKDMADKNRRNLSRFGAFVRTRARSSMRKRKTISEQGSPPCVHEGSLKRLVLFAYDSRMQSVVIGPLLFKEGRAETLEKGGVITAHERDGRLVIMKYEPRPFMGPAFQKELDAGPEKLWQQ